MPEIGPRDRSTILIHYYRAMVGRADTWRMRMDATTNWAIGATGLVITVVLGNPDVPHYVVFVASLLTLCFLLLEARRLTFYHLWQQRVLLLERGLIRPALVGERSDGATHTNDGEPAFSEELEPHLGRTVPSMSLGKAASRRLRRVYIYLFAVQLGAWLLKLSSQPGPASSLRELASRADTGWIPGPVFFGVSGLAFAGALVAAIVRGGVHRSDK